MNGGAAAVGCVVADWSRQPALAFIQKMVARGNLPEIAILNNVCATCALASVALLSSSRRKCRRSVLTDRMSITHAISCCGVPYADIDFTVRRCSGVGINRGRAMSFTLPRKPCVCNAPLGTDLVEGATIGLQ